MSSFDKNTFASWSHVYSLILILIKIEPTEQHSYWERHSTIPQMNQWLTGEKSYPTILFSPKRAKCSQDIQHIMQNRQTFLCVTIYP